MVTHISASPIWTKISRFLPSQLPVFVALFGLAVLLQRGSGAFQSEFGAHPDEAAHVVTGLLLHDYVASRDWREPIRFAEEYYVHYPKVAFGHWPPVFYVLQAGWTLILGASSMNLLLLLACCCAVLGTMVYEVVRQHFNAIFGIAGAVVFTSSPLIRESTSSVMAELPVALLCFMATVAFAKYMNCCETKVRWMWAFSVPTILAVLTKGNGYLLTFIPPLAILMTRRFDVFRRPSLWIMACFIVAICSPFYLLTLDMQRNGMEHESFSLSFVRAAFWYYSRELVSTVPAGFSLLIIVGVADQVVVPFRQKRGISTVLAALGALIVGTWMFQVLVPCGLERRHLAVVVAPLTVFMCAGLHWCWSRVPWRSPAFARVAAVLMGCFLVLYAFVFSPAYLKNWGGFDKPVLEIERRDKSGECVTMVSSDPQGEGMMIANMALRDRHRPSRYALRASKMLGGGRWSGADYGRRFESNSQMSDYLDKISLRFLIIDRSFEGRDVPEHHRQLIELVESSRKQWQLIDSFDIRRRGVVHRSAIQLYENADVQSQPATPIEIDMSPMLGRKISSKVRSNKQLPSSREN